ncbi:MAG: hypothetical protein ACXVEF_20890 [Polyangiales bacterium]
MDREDQAKRLHDEVPALKSLRMVVGHRRGEMGFSASEFVRVIIVARAPALFVVPCGDPACRDGGHEITDEVLRALRAGKVSFEGSGSCNGSLGTAASPCTTLMRYRCEAAYA